MTVADLIDKLKKFPPDMRIFRNDSEYGSTYAWDVIVKTVLIEPEEYPMVNREKQPKPYQEIVVLIS